MANFALRFRNAITSAVLVLLAATGVATAQTPVKVVTSFSILADVAREIGKERVSLVSLVGPNGDAHAYQAKPADAKAVKEAGIVIINGLGFDSFMTRLVKSSGTKAALVTASSGLKALEKAESEPHSHDHGHSHGKLDPHAWQSIEAMKLYTTNIRDGLSKADPAGAQDYARNAARYLAELEALKAELEKGFAAIPREKRVIITNHDAFRYFGNEFGFTLAPVQGISTEGEPSAKDVARIIRAAKEKKARAIFIENMANPKIAEQIARETGARIGGTLFSDALSDEKGPAPTYIALMRHNAKVLVEALRE